MLINSSASAQSPAPKVINIEGLAAKIDNNIILINWTSSATNENYYWEVQGSKNGKEFSTIGLVLGADPLLNGGVFKFKQEVAKMKPGLKYYRILGIENARSAFDAER